MTECRAAKEPETLPERDCSSMVSFGCKSARFRQPTKVIEDERSRGSNPASLIGRHQQMSTVPDTLVSECPSIPGTKPVGFMIQQMKKWLAEAAQSLRNAGKSLASPKKKAEMALEEARKKVDAGSSHIPLVMAEQLFRWGQYERCLEVCNELF